MKYRALALDLDGTLLTDRESVSERNLRAVRRGYAERRALAGNPPPGIMRPMSEPSSRWSGRPVWAEIDLDAVAHNVRLLAARAAPAQVYAVVKANAYGHGAVAVGRTALASGATGRENR